MASALVERIWDGPFTAKLPDGRVFKRGDVVSVTPEQAASGHFKVPPKSSSTPLAKVEAES